MRHVALMLILQMCMITFLHENKFVKPVKLQRDKNDTTRYHNCLLIYTLYGKIKIRSYIRYSDVLLVKMDCRVT
jgi:hypothetical protein